MTLLYNLEGKYQIKLSLQNHKNWWHIFKDATNFYDFGGTSKKFPPIFVNDGGNNEYFILIDIDKAAT